MKGLPDYIQGLKVSQGPLAGQPVKLLPWERRFLRGAFAPKVTTAALTLARGNGKTSLVAAIGAACLNGPLSQERGEVVIVASSFGQAHLCFEHTLWFLSPALEAAKRDWRIRDSTGMAEIEYRPLVLQRRFLNVVSFWPEIASLKARPQSYQARGQLAMRRHSRSLSSEASL